MDLEEADQTAEQAHRGQSRAHGAPYIDHPRAVRRFTQTLAEAVGLAIDDALLATALLHDVIEDSEIDEATLRERFGEVVAGRVAALSKPPKRGDVPKAERTAAYFASLVDVEDEVRLVKIADRLHNLLELPLTRDPERVRRYLDQTVAHVLPLAEGARSAAVARGLSRAVQDAVATCARLCGVPPPGDASAALLSGVYPIVDVGPDTDADAALAQLEAVCAGGARVAQLRVKNVEDREALALCESAVERVRETGVVVVINDRADLARLSGAGGLHVGTTDVPAARARELLSDEHVVGSSSHTASQASGVVAQAGLDYVAFGPVFESPTKQGHAEVTGVDALAQIVERSELPVVAIGGITSAARMIDIARAGAAMGAVISAVARADDPKEATRLLGVAWAAASGARS
jgi:thiamine-phosphate pyrophosphorylase